MFVRGGGLLYKSIKNLRVVCCFLGKRGRNCGSIRSGCCRWRRGRLSVVRYICGRPIDLPLTLYRWLTVTRRDLFIVSGRTVPLGWHCLEISPNKNSKTVDGVMGIRCSERTMDPTVLRSNPSFLSRQKKTTHPSVQVTASFLSPGPHLEITDQLYYRTSN